MVDIQPMFRPGLHSGQMGVVGSGCAVRGHMGALFPFVFLPTLGSRVGRHS